MIQLRVPITVKDAAGITYHLGPGDVINPDSFIGTMDAIVAAEKALLKSPRDKMMRGNRSKDRVK